MIRRVIIQLLLNGFSKFEINPISIQYASFVQKENQVDK